jgi:Holliday junction resolvasome RuvABC endonuclease subunit
MKNINYICIDPSKSCTGVFCWSRKTGTQYHSSIKSKAKESEKEIYSKIYDNISMSIELDSIDLVIIEENPFSGFNKSRSPSKLAEVIGIIKLAAYRANPNIEIISISNALWKGILKGYPFINTKKNKKYLESGIKLLKKDFKTCDEIDAYCIALSMNMLYKTYGFTDAQIRMKERLHEVVKQIESRKKELF